MHVVLNQPENVELARYYMKTLREVKEKKVIRLYVVVFKAVYLYFCFIHRCMTKVNLVSLSRCVIVVVNAVFMFYWSFFQVLMCCWRYISSAQFGVNALSYFSVSCVAWFQIVRQMLHVFNKTTGIIDKTASFSLLEQKEIGTSKYASQILQFDFHLFKWKWINYYGLCTDSNFFEIENFLESEIKTNRYWGNSLKESRNKNLTLVTKMVLFGL